jgi:hypothetical protein
MTILKFFVSTFVAGVAITCFGSSMTQAAPLMTEQQLPSFASANIVRVGDRLINRPIRAPGARQTQAPVTQAQNAAAVSAALQTKYAEAAGSAGNALTKQAALAHGWGWAADHFAEIDTANKGTVSLGDVLNYASSKSGMALPHPAASEGSPQIIQ